MPEVLCTSLSNGSSCPRSRQSHRYYLISPVPCSLLSYKSSLGGCWRSHTRASYNLPRYFESFLSRRTATTPPPPPCLCRNNTVARYFNGSLLAPSCPRDAKASFTRSRSNVRSRWGNSIPRDGCWKGNDRFAIK